MYPVGCLFMASSPTTEKVIPHALLGMTAVTGLVDAVSFCRSTFILRLAKSRLADNKGCQSTGVGLDGTTLLLSTMAMTNGGSLPLSCRARTSYGRMFDEKITDRVKIQASYEPCKSLRFKQERKQSCNTSVVMESSTQKVCLHRGAFYLRSSLAGSPCWNVFGGNLRLL
jgi:hypothetical protein